MGSSAKHIVKVEKSCILKDFQYAKMKHSYSGVTSISNADTWAAFGRTTDFSTNHLHYEVISSQSPKAKTWSELGTLNWPKCKLLFVYLNWQFVQCVTPPRQPAFRNTSHPECRSSGDRKWMDGRTDGRMDGWKFTFRKSIFHILSHFIAAFQRSAFVIQVICYAKRYVHNRKWL